MPICEMAIDEVPVGEIPVNECLSAKYLSGILYHDGPIHVTRASLCTAPISCQLVYPDTFRRQKGVMQAAQKNDATPMGRRLSLDNHTHA
jgi:hypothetical protein